MSDGAIIRDGEKQLVLSRCLTCGQPRLLELCEDGTCAHDTGCGCVRAFTTYAAASPASAPAEDRTPSETDAPQAMRDAAEGLRWALDILDMYDERLVQLGDPRDRVYSAVHVRAKRRAREAVDAAHAIVARLTAELADYALLKQAVNHSADCGPTCTPDGCAEDCPRLNTARWLTDQQREITRLTAALDWVRDDAYDALDRFGHHSGHCRVSGDNRCSCGLDDIRARLSAARTQPEGSNG